MIATRVPSSPRAYNISSHDWPHVDTVSHVPLLTWISSVMCHHCSVTPRKTKFSIYFERSVNNAVSGPCQTRLGLRLRRPRSHATPGLARPVPGRTLNDVASNRPNSARNSGLVTRKSKHETKNQRSRLFPVIRSDRYITLAYGHRRSSNLQTARSRQAEHSLTHILIRTAPYLSDGLIR
jgi:hypothetical protein